MTDWQALAGAAWTARANARIIGPTRVGAAVMSTAGNVYAGCNVEHKFRSHCIHAETNALSNMIAAGDTQAQAVLIVSAREQFTPCGGCLDWIFELGGPATQIAHLGEGWPIEDAQVYRADELMPVYPS